MGSIRDELMDTMWDTVECSKHSWTGPDRRFSCPHCEDEKDKIFQQDRGKAKAILESYGLSHMVKYNRVG